MLLKPPSDAVATHVDVSSLLVRYARVDQVMITVGAIFVLGLYSTSIPEIEALTIGASMLVVSVLLHLSIRRLEAFELRSGLFLAIVGHWFIGLLVAAAVAWLWPVMIVPVLSPVVVVTPFVRGNDWFVTAAISIAVVLGVTVLGLHGPGVDFEELPSPWQTILLCSGLAAALTPVAVGMWNNHRLIRDGFEETHHLNAELSTSQAELAASRRRVVDATDHARRQIEQDLHDGAQQRLLALGIRLQVFQQDPSRVSAAALFEIEKEVRRAIEELRELAHGVYPPMLQTDGLEYALKEIAERSPVPMIVTLEDVGELDESIVTAVYFSTLEAVTNAAKYAPDSVLQVELRRVEEPFDELHLSIGDDGPGFNPESPSATLGLTTMRDRVTAIGGTLTIESTPGEGTIIRAQIPLAS